MTVDKCIFILKMSTKEDDTLPLPAYSQEFTEDMTADEDFIPTSQPCGVGNINILKKSEENPQEAEENPENISEIPPSVLSPSTIGTTLPADSIIDETQDRDKSNDFIPETETKKRKIDYSKEEILSRKKLQIDSNFVKCTNNIFESQATNRWDMDVSKVPESPALDTQDFSVVNETPRNSELSSFINKIENKIESLVGKKVEESVAEVLVNDTADTLELDATPLIKDYNKSTENKENLKALENSGSNLERSDEVRGFKNSSVLLLDRPEPSCVIPTHDKIPSTISSEKLYLQETIVDDEFSASFSNQQNISVLGCSLPIVEKMSKEFSNQELQNSGNTEPSLQNEGIIDELKREASTQPINSTPRSSPETLNSSSVEVKKMEFKLSVSCMVTMNVKTKQVIQKFIVNVNELPHYKSKSKLPDHSTDNTSDKRCSTTSSGSVYSDKTGLPFNLPKRMSTISDTSDSSEEGFSKRFLDGRKALYRTPWSNEYLLLMKMDELMKASLEIQDSINSSKVVESPKKVQTHESNGKNSLENITESPLPEPKSTDYTQPVKPEVDETNNREGEKEENVLKKNHTEEPTETKDDIKKTNCEIKLSAKNESSSHSDNSRSDFADPKEKIETIPLEEQPKTNSEKKEPDHVEKVSEVEPNTESLIENKSNDEDSFVQLCDGVPVFARWTDKNYYSGVLSGSLKNERWDVRFDDGKLKSIKESFVIPAKWLKEGELVFALVDNKYISGQIVNIKLENYKKMYVVELDWEKKNVTVSVTDLCLSEVMADIVKEKHKMYNVTPSLKNSSHIDFDNVLMGKRLRELRTPLRTAINQSSVTKKKSSTKAKKEEVPKSSEKQNNSVNKTVVKEPDGLEKEMETEMDVEDKIISTSAGEENSTPSRSVGREIRRKSKPRSLTYEGDEDNNNKKKIKTKLSEWVAPDGTPIPGPSNVKFKRRTRSGTTRVKVSSKSALTSVDEEKSSPLSHLYPRGCETSKKGKSPSSKYSKKSPTKSHLIESNRGKRNLTRNKAVEAKKSKK